MQDGNSNGVYVAEPEEEISSFQDTLEELNEFQRQAGKYKIQAEHLQERAEEEKLIREILTREVRHMQTKKAEQDIELISLHKTIKLQNKDIKNLTTSKKRLMMRVDAQRHIMSAKRTEMEQVLLAVEEGRQLLVRNTDDMGRSLFIGPAEGEKGLVYDIAEGKEVDFEQVKAEIMNERLKRKQDEPNDSGTAGQPLIAVRTYFCNCCVKAGRLESKPNLGSLAWHFYDPMSLTFADPSLAKLATLERRLPLEVPDQLPPASGHVFRNGIDLEPHLPWNQGQGELRDQDLQPRGDGVDNHDLSNGIYPGSDDGQAGQECRDAIRRAGKRSHKGVRKVHLKDTQSRRQRDEEEGERIISKMGGSSWSPQERFSRARSALLSAWNHPPVRHEQMQSRSNLRVIAFVGATEQQHSDPANVQRDDPEEMQDAESTTEESESEDDRGWMGRSQRAARGNLTATDDSMTNADDEGYSSAKENPVDDEKKDKESKAAPQSSAMPPPIMSTAASSSQRTSQDDWMYGQHDQENGDGSDPYSAWESRSP